MQIAVTTAGKSSAEEKSISSAKWLRAMMVIPMGYQKCRGKRLSRWMDMAAAYIELISEAGYNDYGDPDSNRAVAVYASEKKYAILIALLEVKFDNPLLWRKFPMSAERNPHVEDN